MLDLWQQNTGVAAQPQPTEGHDLPAGFGDTFDAAWHEGQLFSSSVSGFNARNAALNDYVSDIQRRTGKQLELNPEGGADLWAQANQQAADLKAKGFDVEPLADEEIDRRTAAIAGQARQDYQAMAGREKTFGGKLGMLAGGLASGTVDPLNLVGLAVAPEAELGVLGTAALFGGLGAGSQVGNEIINFDFRKGVVPGYSARDAAGNVVESAVGGAALGGLFKGMGAIWQRMKTGEWGRSVRDAGNIVESEANVQASNPFAGPEGEAAHIEALSKAIEDVLRGRPVGVETPPVDTAIDAAMERRGTAAAVAEEARAARVPTDELPFEATAKEAVAEQQAASLADQIKFLGVPEDEAAGLASRILASKSDDEARAILNETMARPQTIAETVPSVSAVAKAERAAQAEPLPRAAADQLTPEAMGQAFADPNHDVALMTDLERIRDTGAGPQMIPVGVDEKGEPQFKLLDAAIQDAKNDQEAALQIESCINPPQEEAAE